MRSSKKLYPLILCQGSKNCVEICVLGCVSELFLKEFYVFSQEALSSPQGDGSLVEVGCLKQIFMPLAEDVLVDCS